MSMKLYILVLPSKTMLRFLVTVMITTIVFIQKSKICDGKDNNCDGEIDEDSAINAIVQYYDDDDGYGDECDDCNLNMDGMSKMMKIVTIETMTSLKMLMNV